MSNLPNIKSGYKSTPAGKAPNQNYFDQDEEDLDGEGHPLTVKAAVRLYHQKSNNKNVYCHNQLFKSPRDSAALLSQNKY